MAKYTRVEDDEIEKKKPIMGKLTKKRAEKTWVWLNRVKSYGYSFRKEKKEFTHSKMKKTKNYFSNWNSNTKFILFKDSRWLNGIC